MSTFWLSLSFGCDTLGGQRLGNFYCLNVVFDETDGRRDVCGRSGEPSIVAGCDWRGFIFGQARMLLLRSDMIRNVDAC